MFRPMRRIKQQLAQDEALEVLKNAKRGVLSVIGDDGWPYGIHLNPYWEDGRLYFHGAKAGHKIDALRRDARTSFTVILDGAKVKFGDNVFIAPNCSFYTAGHPLDVERRNKGLEYAYPITVGDNVWIGGNVTVCPGVTIGNNSVIGAGAVVTHDIPDNSLAFGVPARVARKIENGPAER